MTCYIQTCLQSRSISFIAEVSMILCQILLLFDNKAKPCEISIKCSYVFGNKCEKIQVLYFLQTGSEEIMDRYQRSNYIYKGSVVRRSSIKIHNNSNRVGVSFLVSCWLKVCKFVKKKLRCRCFPDNFAKSFRTPINNTYWNWSTRNYSWGATLMRRIHRKQSVVQYIDYI